MKIIDFGPDWIGDERKHKDPGDHDLLESVMDGEEVPDSPREKVKIEKEYYKNYARTSSKVQELVRAESKGFNVIYVSVAVVCCALLIGMLLFTISYLPRYGVENPESGSSQYRCGHHSGLQSFRYARRIPCAVHRAHVRYGASSQGQKEYADTVRGFLYDPR